MYCIPSYNGSSSSDVAEVRGALSEVRNWGPLASSPNFGINISICVRQIRLRQMVKVGHTVVFASVFPTKVPRRSSSLASLIADLK